MIKNLKILSFLVCTAIFTASICGCASFRKKFVRQKKEDKKEKFIPVLDPIDYGDATISPLDKYAHHHSLYKVWDRELLQGIERKASEKRQEYFLSQMVVQLEEMMRWSPQPVQVKLQKLIFKLQDVQKIYEQPPQVRSANSLRKKINAVGRIIRQELKPEMIYVES